MFTFSFYCSTVILPRAKYFLDRKAFIHVVRKGQAPISHGENAAVFSHRSQKYMYLLYRRDRSSLALFANLHSALSLLCTRFLCSWLQARREKSIRFEEQSTNLPRHDHSISPKVLKSDLQIFGARQACDLKNGNTTEH